VGALNVPDVAVGGMRQTGRKAGSIGHPIPGVTMRIADPQTGATLPPGTEGVLMVKGPNVMLGYLDSPQKTAEVLRGGWYDTGDMGRMDADGFVFLTGRLSRFSKIGGEMVPHLAVEDKLLEALRAVHPVLVVTAADDPSKGEQLVVFYTDEAGDADALLAVIRDGDLPNLWKPRRENLFRIEALPTLGSGKLDLKALKDMAQEAVKQRKMEP
jgi:acyl-[acyl-carrier-protein]-phospholipid O-acyltransferase/long-chain-fatty-acid--[acyl-carrier-protein] ligase